MRQFNAVLKYAVIMPLLRAAMGLAILVGGELIMAGATIAAPSTVAIDQGRQFPNGVEVQLSGRVTVASAQFESASLDQGFAIQDVSGGIYVHTQQDLELSNRHSAG